MDNGRPRCRQPTPSCHRFHPPGSVMLAANSWEPEAVHPVTVLSARSPDRQALPSPQPARSPAMSETAVPAEVVVGVDTHKHVHAAVAIDGLGTRLGATAVPVRAEGY